MNPTLRSSKCRVPLAYSWSHAGAIYRVTPWPDVQFERRYGTEWVPMTPSAAAMGVGVNAGGAAWRGYVEFLPTEVREFLGYFRVNRLLALHVAARCPEIVGALSETPALTAFVAAHATLRGAGESRWHEVNAVFERGGVYGLLDWLGLPATRQTLAILHNIVAADLAPALLEPLRRLFWRPQGIFALAQLPAITERELTDACALAA